MRLSVSPSLTELKVPVYKCRWVTATEDLTELRGPNKEGPLRVWGAGWPPGDGQNECFLSAQLTLEREALFYVQPASFGTHVFQRVIRLDPTRLEKRKKVT